MDERSQKRFDEIVKKEPGALNQAEIDFLKARSSYLNSVQKQIYTEVLNKKVEPVTPPDPDEGIDNDNPDVSYRDLQRKAKEHGLPFVGVTREDLLKSIDTIEGPGGSENPN